jgi:glycosyltransferase involved in cell wall biosynthesis
MAAGIPAVGCAGEDGPEEIAATGAGMVLVAPRDPGALTEAVSALLADHSRLAEAGARARETVLRSFTWERCGQETMAAYASVL